MKYDFTSLVTWLNDQVNKASFADVSINLKIHDGKITLIEKSISEKSKLLTGNTGDCYGKK